MTTQSELRRCLSCGHVQGTHQDPTFCHSCNVIARSNHSHVNCQGFFCVEDLLDSIQGKIKLGRLEAQVEYDLEVYARMIEEIDVLVQEFREKLNRVYV